MNTIERFARNPAKVAKEDRATAGLLLFLALVAIAVLRRRSLPDQRGAIAIAATAFVLVVVANFAPDLVFYVLLAAIIVSVVQNADVLTQTFNLGVSRVQSALGQG